MAAGRAYDNTSNGGNVGLIRLLLAVSVAIDHVGGVGGYRMGPGSSEVDAFFVISGFYMCLILHDRYYRLGIAAFYSNRYARLFPSYAIVAVATLGFLAFTGYSHRFGMPLADAWQYLMASPLLALYAVTANATIFLLDASLYLWFDGQSLALTKNFYDSPVHVYRFLLVPQGWSLGVELTFYAFAPFLLRSTRRIVIGICLSLAIMSALLWAGLPGDPWGHRFFPSVAHLFLLGALSWRLWGPMSGEPIIQMLGLVCAIFITALMVSYAYLPIPEEAKRLALLSAVVVGVGPIFALSRSSALDRAIGELSYPVYVSHFLAFSVAAYSLSVDLAPAAALMLTLAISVMLTRFVEMPAERWRAQRLTRRTIPETVEKIGIA